MDYFSFPILQLGSLSGSLTTSVWVGVLVSCFFNLRFGWVLGGLVVPGYLVPLLMIKPWAVAVIFLEATVTFSVVLLFSEFLARFGMWNSLFGRDRFFAILLVSVMVRLFFDILLLPELGRVINRTLHLTFDYETNLRGIGLIVVALFANRFWKPGWLAGTIQMAVSVAVTYFIVRYGLMVFTDYSISDLGRMYSDKAEYLWLTPKSYIIILVTAYTASRMNLDFGWEYGGILIPALLALQWHEPFKIMVTFLEAFVILAVGALTLRLPIFQDANMAGARKILFFFNIGFLYELLLGYCIQSIYGGNKIMDFYGFGYLITTLMAVEMYDKDIAVRSTVATIKTSLIAMLVASLLGYSLTFLSHLP
ncbi:poly-gamma-glutamate biosynthesis protein PgsC/CapC [Thermodesulfobacteriota bacterium]